MDHSIPMTKLADMGHPYIKPDRTVPDKALKMREDFSGPFIPGSVKLVGIKFSGSF